MLENSKTNPRRIYLIINRDYYVNLTNLNLVEQGNSSLGLKVEVSLPLMWWKFHLHNIECLRMFLFVKVAGLRLEQTQRKL